EHAAFRLPLPAARRARRPGADQRLHEKASMSPSRIAVVTGAGTGIGKAAAVALLREGWSVALAGRRKEKLDEALAEAGGAASRALAVITDVGKPESVRALFAKTKEKFGRLDLLFNNAGIGTPGAILLEDLDYEKWKAVV